MRGNGEVREGPLVAVLCLCAASYTIAQGVVIPALPQIQSQFGVSGEATTFVFSAYLVSAAVATPILGKLGDMFGKKPMLLVTLAIFSLGSLICALAGSIGVLIAGRAVQGVAAALFPLAFGIIRDELPPERVGSGIGLVSSVLGIGGGVGFVLGGVLIDVISLHSIFWLSLGAGVIGLACAHRFVPPSTVRFEARIDWGGGALLSLGLLLALVGVSGGTSWGWTSPEVLGLLISGMALLIAFVRFELHHPEPLLDVGMMRERTVLTTNTIAFLVGFGIFSSTVLIAGFAQVPAAAGFGFATTVTGAAVLLLPHSAVVFVAGPVAGRLSGLTGSKLPLVIGTAVATISSTFLALGHSAPWTLMVGGALSGLGVGFAFASMSNLVVEVVDHSVTGVASGLNVIMRMIGGAVGSQIAASLIAAHATASGLPTEHGYVLAFAASAAALGLGFVLSLRVPVSWRSPAVVVAAARAD